MHYLYVGYYVDDETFNMILEEKIHSISPARQKFEYNLIRSLNDLLGNQIDFVSYVPTNGKIVIPKQTELEGSVIQHILINKKDYKSILSARRQFVKYLESMEKEKLQNLCVIMYAVNPVFLQPLLHIKKKYSIKLITICSEVPALRRFDNSIKSRIQKAILTNYNEKFDGYVLFSEKMREVVRMKEKPYIVLEGIAPEIESSPILGKKNVVMYAGGLAGDNNIRLLADVCMKLENLDELWICGAGQDQDYIEQCAKDNKKIKYFGRLPNEEVIKLETQAKLLVNLRNPEETLTRYSFPSKILEYMSVGTMVLTTKLEGIPDEYYNYVQSIEDLSVNSVRDKLNSILSMNEDDYMTECTRAKTFVDCHKNAAVQTQKILNLVHSM